MKIKSSGVPALLKKNAYPAAILLYGDDRGLLAECAETIYRHVIVDDDEEVEMFDVTRMHASEMDPERLILACETVPLVSKRRFVLMRDVEQLNAANRQVVVRLLQQERWMKRTVLVLLSGVLEARDPMRRAFENHPTAWCVPFYPMVGAEWQQWLKQRLGQHGLEIEPDALDRLADRLEGDSQSATQELDKLALYMGSSKRVGLGDVLATIGESAGADSAELPVAITAGRTDVAIVLLERLLDAGQEPLMLLGMTVRRLRQLARFNALVHQGKRPEEAMSELRIFWKEQQEFATHARQWDDRRVAHGLLACGNLDRVLKGAAPPRPASEVLGWWVLRLVRGD
jgi:DNA polymerase-3 subunit delta